MDKKRQDLVNVFLAKSVREKWKQDYVSYLLNLSNEELLNRMLDEQQADDYDGGFTEQ